eukprot:jgi/Chlat1/3989/Chrsp26S03984
MAGSAVATPAAALLRTAATSSYRTPQPRGSVRRDAGRLASSRTASSFVRGVPLTLRQASMHTRSVANTRTATQAVAAPPAPVYTNPFPGYTQIGEPIPDEISMSDVLKTLPKEVFEVNDLKAWRSVAVTVASVAAGYVALANSPWYLLPAVYAYMSAAVTGLFVIGHDCGHNSFSKNQLVNDIVGTLVFMPLVYPFEPWRIKHNTHHAHTNKLVLDTAWQPFRVEQYKTASLPMKAGIHSAYGPAWYIASIGHWAIWHFDINKYRPAERPRVWVSLAAVAAFIGAVLVPMLVTQGPLFVAKYWVMPWLGFHFWMSTFTMVHHTAPHIPFTKGSDWSQVKAQLGGTVHCDYPSWIETLCHDISVHVPHHLNTKIPSYNLRPAYESLKQNWGKYMTTAEFGLPLMSTIIKKCQLYDDKKLQYVPYSEGQKK